MKNGIRLFDTLFYLLVASNFYIFQYSDVMFPPAAVGEVFRGSHALVQSFQAVHQREAAKMDGMSFKPKKAF